MVLVPSSNEQFKVKVEEARPAGLGPRPNVSLALKEGLRQMLDGEPGRPWPRQ